MTYHSVTTLGVIGFMGTPYFLARPKSAESMFRSTKRFSLLEFVPAIIFYNSIPYYLPILTHPLSVINKLETLRSLQGRINVLEVGVSDFIVK